MAADPRTDWSDAKSWGLQLADSAPATDEQATILGNDGYCFDVKWDGVRCLLIADSHGVTLLTRKGEDMTHRWPDVVEAVEQLRSYSTIKDFVLDGEIIVFNAQTGVPEFRLTARRKRQNGIEAMAAQYPATFVAFDCLAYEDADLRTLRQDLRLQHLELIVPPGMVRIKRSIYDLDGVTMMELVRAQNLEGLIAKDLSATYRAGRSKRWIKMKPLSSLTAIVTGWTVGTGWREEYFGALELSLLDNGNLIGIGEVGTGFNRADLDVLDPLVKSGQELLVEIQYQERTEINPDGTGGKLRFPSFKGLRFDVDRSEASVAQFDRDKGA